ncbi:hypothetical protein [Thaumasiovibrio subtropicus]|uniref:hypothetical protein n=1 Tax=Thaumasiovibrio subtropicus TaxID=1891207 RepID=UPI000B35BFA0|nr:hypothetical protein [Thaumasiovibrio subtropicus]
MNQQELSVACDQLADSQPAGVYPIVIEDKKFWIKVCGEDKYNVIRRFSAWLAQFELMQFFKTNAVQSPQHRLSREIDVMSTLADKGVAVPTVVTSSDRFYVTTDAGRTLNSLKPEEVPHDLGQKVFALFTRLHRNHVVHGRPAMRDMLLNEDGSLTLIDFEESTIGNHPQLMARDMFLLLMDLCRLPTISEQDKLAGLREWQSAMSDKAWLELKRIGKLLNKFKFVAKGILLFKDNRTSKQILNALAIIDKA